MSRITNKQWHYHVLIQSFYTAILSSFIIIITDIIRPYLKKYYSWTYYDNDGKEKLFKMDTCTYNYIKCIFYTNYFSC